MGKSDIGNDKHETIQDIAIKLVEEQFHSIGSENEPKQRTVFILGSKGVGKSRVINRFLDRDDKLRPTLALDYSFGRRSSSGQSNQKQVVNIWELGSLDNSEELIEIPMRLHGVSNFATIIMIDLTQPNRLWLDLETAYLGLKKTYAKLLNEEEAALYEERASERIKKNHVDMPTLQLMPFPVILVGGKYDEFMNFDPEIKKHVCQCLRSMAHVIGAALLFYSQNIPKLAKTLRDAISHLSFGSPSRPFRSHITEYNDALSIWFGKDSWKSIGVDPASVNYIGSTLNIDIPQMKESPLIANTSVILNPTTDPGFLESIIDEMRAQKDEELKTYIRESSIKEKFESIIN